MTMKKIIFSLATVSVLFFASSCKECSTCTKSGSPELKYCEKDYNSKAAYDDAGALATLGGYDCN